MTEYYQVYKCAKCSNIIEVKHTGEGQLMCCNEPMINIITNIESASKEKHIPFVIDEGNIIKIQIGEVLHPMEDKHYIEWIEIIADERVYNRCLKPGDVPIIEFNVINLRDEYIVRTYCNIHGMWEIKKEVI